MAIDKLRQMSTPPYIEAGGRSVLLDSSEWLKRSLNVLILVYIQYSISS